MRPFYIRFFVCRVGVNCFPLIMCRLLPQEHMVNGSPRRLLVHRKGATRAFPPHHPLIPSAYQLIGQPVLVGGCMGSCSYVLTGTEKGMRDTFGSTCHGAGRALSRNAARNTLSYNEVLEKFESMHISVRNNHIQLHVSFDV